VEILTQAIKGINIKDTIEEAIDSIK